MKESNSVENVVNKGGVIIRDGCNVKSVRVMKADRKGKSYNDKPHVLVATIENREQVTEVLKS